MQANTENITSQEHALPETLNNQPEQTLATDTTLLQKETAEEHKQGEVAKIPEKTTLEFEQLGGKGIYTVLTKTDRLCGPQIWKRVLREVKDVNDDFKTLRTTIGVVADMIGALHFLMYPSDGAMADKPLCGRILIPKTYPDIAPVVHLFTRTNRANLDNYHSFGEDRNLEQMHSSMCFDLVNPASHHASWKPEYTLSALISSLLQAIVSFKVAQIGGGEIAEFVSMEKLGAIHKSVESTYAHYQSIMPSRKEIVHLEGMKVDTKYFKLPEKITSLKNNQDLITQSDPIFLQVPNDKMKESVYSIGLDLSDLKTNISTVFSIILSTDPSDPVGKKSSTILVRNGVTATAAKKTAGKPIDWFYHGKPMNESDLKLIVTVGYNQFCISYYDGERKAIHGDRPVSCLTPAEIGSVGTQPFYLSLFMKNKGGPTVTVKTFIPESGYIHPVAGGHS